MADDPTKYAETNALLAVMSENHEDAKRIVQSMLPGERRQLRRAMAELSAIIAGVNEDEPRPEPVLAHCVHHGVHRPTCIGCLVAVDQLTRPNSLWR